MRLLCFLSVCYEKTQCLLDYKCVSVRFFKQFSGEIKMVHSTLTLSDRGFSTSLAAISYFRRSIVKALSPQHGGHEHTVNRRELFLKTHILEEQHTRHTPENLQLKDICVSTSSFSGLIFHPPFQASYTLPVLPAPVPQTHTHTHTHTVSKGFAIRI